MVEEAHRAGIEEILFVTARGKEAIENYFDADPELEAFLAAKGKHDERRAVAALSRPGKYHFVRQGEVKGLGHAVYQARAFTGNDPFAVFLPDDVIVGEPPAIAALLAVHEKTGAAVVGLERIPMERISAYGVVAAKAAKAKRGGFGAGLANDEVFRVLHVVEKPPPEKTPSDLAIVGRYLLIPEIHPLLAKTAPGAGGEVQLSDALNALAKKGRLYGVLLPGRRFDTGTPAGMLEAAVARALAKDDEETGRLRWILAGCAGGGC